MEILKIHGGARGSCGFQQVPGVIRRKEFQVRRNPDGRKVLLKGGVVFDRRINLNGTYAY